MIPIKKKIVYDYRLETEFFMDFQRISIVESVKKIKTEFSHKNCIIFPRLGYIYRERSHDVLDSQLIAII